ncbi:MAG: universal stress protein [Helicobacter sp.]|nr:universal stress protein [Helicobacter sp.]
MKKVLFAIDDTPECERAAQFLVDFFTTDYAFTLIHIKADFVLYGDAVLASYDEGQDSEEQRAKETMGKFESLFASKNHKPTMLLKEGEPVQQVLEEVKDYDLLVIGRSTDSFFNKIFSSNQDDFITKAPIPVLLVK